jgi:predicted PurR-regulated permease PerM
MTDQSKHRLIRILLTTTIITLFAVMFYPFFTPILLAGLFAFALEDRVTKWTARFGRRPLIISGVILSLCLFVAAPMIFVILKLISSIKEYSIQGLQNSQIYKLTEQLLTTLTGQLNSFAGTLDLDLTKLPQLSDILAKSSGTIAGFATNFIALLPEWTLSVLVFIAVLYYFLAESVAIKKFALKLNLLSSAELNQVISIIKKSSHLTFFASVVVGCLQALVVALSAYFCGFTEFTIVFVITFVFSLIPVIGAAPVAVFLAILGFIQGQNGVGIGMMVAAAVAGSVDNVVKPLIVNSSSEDVHPVISLLALIGAIVIYGAPGILLGPVLTELAFKIGTILFPHTDSDENST